MSNDNLVDFGQMAGSNAHPNPMFDFLTGFVPRKLKDLFRWTEYLFYNSPHIFQALTKLADYVLTDITIETDKAGIRDNYEAFFRKKKVMSTLKACARDRMIYGNVFVSVYYPKKHQLKCSVCGDLYALQKIDYTYKYKSMEFEFTCPTATCNAHQKASINSVIVDAIKDSKRINIIRWDPKQIDIEHNPVTGDSVYYYNIPPRLIAAIKAGEKAIVNTMPIEFLRAASSDGEMLFKFDDNQLYHMKIDAPAGVDTCWGFPPLTSTLKSFYYTQVLRKANEAIALDHIVPFRVLHPSQTGQTNDPAMMISLARWVEETKRNLKRHRQDPNHIMFSPVALGVTQMGGQGRTLMTVAEVEASEANIVVGLGIPKEFLYGGVAGIGSPVMLRMLENQMLSQRADIIELLQWICDGVGKQSGWAKVEADMTNFKWVDDIQQRSMLMQLDQAYGMLSKRTLAEVNEVDYDSEREQRRAEQLEDARDERKLQQELQKIQNDIAMQASQQASAGNGLTYDQQAVIGEADMLVEQLLGIEPGQRKSQLSALQAEDYVLYSVVIQRLEQAQLNQQAQMKAEAGA